MRTLCLRCDLPVETGTGLEHPTEADCIQALRAEVKQTNERLEEVLSRRMESFTIITKTFEPLQLHLIEMNQLHEEYRRFMVQQQQHIKELEAELAAVKASQP